MRSKCSTLKEQVSTEYEPTPIVFQITMAYDTSAPAYARL